MDCHYGKRWRHRHEHGFTLVELCIGTMIVSMLGAVAAPHLSGLLQQYRLNGATQVVWGDLHRARLTAIKENRTVCLDFTGIGYTIVRVGTPEVLVTTRDLSTQYPGVRLTAPASFAFASSGLLTGSLQTVQIQNAAGIKTVTVLATGRIGSS